MIQQCPQVQTQRAVWQWILLWAPQRRHDGLTAGMVKCRIRPICYWLPSLKALEILTCKQRWRIWAWNYSGWVIEMRNIVKCNTFDTCTKAWLEDVMKSCEICHIITGQRFQAHVWKCHQVNILQVFKAKSHDWCRHLDIFSRAQGLISSAILETFDCRVLHPQL